MSYFKFTYSSVGFHEFTIARLFHFGKDQHSEEDQIKYDSFRYLFDKKEADYSNFNVCLYE